MSEKSTLPSLYHRVRSALALQGTSFNEWCIKQNICRQYAERVLKNPPTSPAAKNLRLKIVRKVGISNADS